jgi:hypothetical protein
LPRRHRNRRDRRDDANVLESERCAQAPTSASTRGRVRLLDWHKFDAVLRDGFESASERPLIDRVVLAGLRT